MVGSVEKRSWSPEKYSDVFSFIAQKYEEVVFVLCGGTDAVDAAKIAQQYVGNKCIDITGKTSLLQVAAVISKCDFYLGSDTGLMHMASAFCLPIIEISASIANSPEYWGSSPTRTGPWKVPAIVLRPDKGLDDCRYMCNKKYAHCINQITESEVEAAIEEMICLVSNTQIRER